MKFFSLIYQGEIHPESEEKVIPADQYSILLEAKEIVAKAKEDAKRLHLQTEEECVELRKAAEEKGFQDGLVKFDEHLLFFDSELKRIRHEAMQAVLPLALKAAKKIVGKELETHPETIVDIVIQALAPVTQSHRIKIYVSREEKEAVEAEKTKIRAILEQVESLSVLERHDIAPGGCIIETEAGIINATIENQWRALEAAFERYMKR
ncbi:MAG: HrpE/YscL family type III secretion apparatus protein [Chlamydiales bacterium]|nr:HrpE/YscL family type III secretion apparatus protein [Chlamydiales bacterium]